MWGYVDKWEVRSALRTALQTAAAAVATYLAMRALGMDAYFIGILSAVYILAPSIGGTLTTGMQRFTATVVGSILGIACLIALPDQYGTAVAIALSMFVLGGVGYLKPAWSYGMVAALALSLRAEEDAVAVAVDRGMAILLGVVVGILCTFVVWPETARKRFERHLASAHRAIGRRARAALEEAWGEIHDEEAREADAAYRDQIEKARNARDAIWFDRDPRRDEKIAATDALYDSVILVDRATDRDADAPLSAHEDFEGHVDAVAKKLVDLIEILAGDAQGDAQSAFDGLDDAIGKARYILTDDDATSDAHLNRAALVFGMQEMRQSVLALFDEIGAGDRRSLVDTALQSTGAGRFVGGG